MVSLDLMKKRIVACIAQRNGKASKADIIRHAAGSKARLIRTIDDLVESGIVWKEGKGTKGSPHIFTLIQVPRSDVAKANDCIVTVIL